MKKLRVKETIKAGEALMETAKSMAKEQGFSEWGLSAWPEDLRKCWKEGYEMTQRVRAARKEKAYNKACENLEFKMLLAKAEDAGEEAAAKNVPTPMVVVGGCPGETMTRYYESEGCCGFAWINFYGAFGKWYKDYTMGDTQKWVSAGGQSISRKEDYAEAFAAVLKEAGVQAYAGSRMD